MTSLTLADIHKARQRLGDNIYMTPCTRSETLSQMLGCELFLKLENLQMTGSFKERGALNKILQLNAQQKRAGIITASAGNHAQAVAYAAQKCHTQAIIVMPETTPLAKIQGTRKFGASIILHGSSYDEAYERAATLQKHHGYTFIHAFDDIDVIAGQGTIGLEILEQVPNADVVVVPVGGGGLIAGIAMAIMSIQPEVRIVGVEPDHMPAMINSIAAGKVNPIPSAYTLADGIAVAKVGQYTLPLVQRYVTGIVTVTEEEIAHAIMTLLEHEKTLAEGAGAVSFAALVNQHINHLENKTVVAIISGGNIDMTMLDRILERGLERDGRLSRIKIIAPDKPDSIPQLASLIAQEHANILEIIRDRASSNVAPGEAEIEVLLETRGAEHVDVITQSLRQHNFTLK